MTQTTTFRTRLRRWVLGVQFTLVFIVLALLLFRDFGMLFFPVSFVQDILNAVGI
jgi:hypothetical protein